MDVFGANSCEGTCFGGGNDLNESFSDSSSCFITIEMKGEETMRFGDQGLVTQASVAWTTPQKDLADTIKKYIALLPVPADRSY